MEKPTIQQIYRNYFNRQYETINTHQRQDGTFSNSKRKATYLASIEKRAIPTPAPVKVVSPKQKKYSYPVPENLDKYDIM